MKAVSGNVEIQIMGSEAELVNVVVKARTCAMAKGLMDLLVTGLKAQGGDVTGPMHIVDNAKYRYKIVSQVMMGKSDEDTIGEI